MAWNPHQVAQMITGDSAGGAFLWNSNPAGGWTHDEILRGSFEALDDIEFKRCGTDAANIAAICGGSSGKCGLVDIRTPQKPVKEWKAHDGDTNVLSWSPLIDKLLLTGGDDGAFKVWDTRINRKDPLANFKWHRAPITSVDWHPTDEAVLVVSSADDTTSIWDMSVEEDNSVPQDTTGADHFPAQLLFLHMGQKDVKEVKFHRQIPGVCVTTGFDGFNIFKTFNV